MSLEDEFREKYRPFLADFKRMSYDSYNKESLCQDTSHRYYNFDAIVKDRSYDETPASPDTLIFKNKEIYCIEFKNSFKKRVNAAIIKEKLEKGHEVLSEILTELGFQIKDYHLTFCTVHKGYDETQEKKARIGQDRIRYGVEKNKIWFDSKQYNDVEKNKIQFDLEQYKGKDKYFDDIITNDVDFFRKQFIQEINKNLPC